MLLRRDMMKDAALPPAAADDKSRTRTFVASNEAPDRYNTTFRAKGWRLDNYARNPLVLWQHDTSLPPVASAVARVAGDKLLADVTFFTGEVNPLSEQLLRMIDAGVLGMSHRFEPIDQQYNGSRETGDEWKDYFYPPIDYLQQELLELSVVNIGANADALPEGRSLLKLASPRTLERLRSSLGPITTPPAPPVIEPVPDVRTLSSDELAVVVRGVVREAVPQSALVAIKRRMGKL